MDYSKINVGGASLESMSIPVHPRRGVQGQIVDPARGLGAKQRITLLYSQMTKINYLVMDKVTPPDPADAKCIEVWNAENPDWTPGSSYEGTKPAPKYLRSGDMKITTAAITQDGLPAGSETRPFEKFVKFNTMSSTSGAMEEQSVFQQFIAALEPYFTRARNRFSGLPALGDRPVQQSGMSDADYQASLREWTAQSSLRGYQQTLLDAVHFSVADVIYLRQMDYWAASLAGGNVAAGADDAAKGLRHGNNFGGLHADGKPIIVQAEVPTLFGTYKVVLEQETLTRSVPAKFSTIDAAKARWDAIFAVAAAVEHMNVITTFKELQLALPGRPQEIICTP